MDEEEEIAENILSICWDNGKLAGVVYNLSTLELSIFNEVIDLKPDYFFLKQIFHQIKPSYLIATGNNPFFDDLVKLLGIEDSDFQKFKVSKKKAANATASNVSFYPLNRNFQEDFRKRIYELDLPGILSQSSKADRYQYIDSIMPMSQEMVVASLGNLIIYLSDNLFKWKHAFLAFDKNPIISNVIVSILESQVLIDDFSFNSLNIFSTIYHPSSFKIQIRKDGLSLFNLLNHCSSAVAVQELKAILRQPTRDIAELNFRQSTVEWCLREENYDHVQRMRGFLSGLVNIHAVFRRIIVNHGNSFNDWKALKRTIFNINSISQICSQIPNESIRSTILKDLVEFYKDGTSINGILFALENIVDIEEIEEKKRFIVKSNLDIPLDEKKEAFKAMVENFNGMQPDDELSNLINANETQSNPFQFIHFPEMGFVVGTSLKLDQMNLSFMANYGIELVLSTAEAVYFKTPNSKILNDLYEVKIAEIIEHEMNILKKLIKYITQNFGELSQVVKVCLKLDCLISFSIVAKKHNYVKPKITTDRQLAIVKGRHPLVELMKPYVNSTTEINRDKKNYINIIRAPNSSGKSCYIKKIALICYMAHIGCYVPAENCTVSLLHSIYSRIHTPESVYHNESAFMSDLQQMSKIVMNSTNRSLILIDEFAKGTFYKDGIAIFTAVIEHFAEREDLCPIVFSTTHYPQITSLVKPKNDSNLSFKTINTKKNKNNVFHSTFELIEGTNEQQCSTKFPESKSIISNIFNNKQRDAELKCFNEAANVSTKAFILILAKMMMRKNHVSYEFIKDIYTKIDIENFLNL